MHTIVGEVEQNAQYVELDVTALVLEQDDQSAEHVRNNRRPCDRIRFLNHMLGALMVSLSLSLRTAIDGEIDESVGGGFNDHAILAVEHLEHRG